jgi:hypothetical protein
MSELHFAKQKFCLGQIVETRNAMAVLNQVVVLAALSRHAHGDWGDLDASDRKDNEWSLEHGERLMSVYFDGETKFWIITERDRSVTTVLLPEDY